MRTLASASKLAQLTQEMEKFNIQIVGISEARYKNSGSITTTSNHHFIYSGNSKTHTNGVGILMTKVAKKALIEWNPISERIILARFHSKLRNTTIIQCYAPTEAAEEREKDQFYEQLQATLLKSHKNDIKIILGDFNAKVGNNNSNNTQVMGKEGLRSTCNNNGSRLIDFCATNQLFIGGTKFPHKDIHKYTWQSPDGVTRNQIDHILISKKFLSSLTDVRTMRSADIYSDHQLVVAKIKIKPKSVTRLHTIKRTKYNIERLKDDSMAQQFQNHVERKLLPDDSDIITEKWNKYVTATQEAAVATIGTKDNTRKPWITDETWELIKLRRNLKAQLNKRQTRSTLNAYNDMEKLVKKSARRDHRQYNNNIIEEAEKAAERRDIRKMYQCITKLTRKQQCAPPIRDNSGRILTSEQQQLHRWQEFFQSNDSNSNETWTPSTNNNNINSATPTEREVQNAIHKLKNNKSAGIDNIPPELIKANTMSSEHLTPIIQSIWENEIIPNEWKEGLIVTIPKKGDLSNCKNWRGITILNIIIKILAMIILERIAPIIHAKLRNEQAGFRPGKSCTDHISSLRIIIEQSAEFNSPLYMAFVDFERAFDTVQRNAIWSALEEFGTPIKLIRLIQELYNNSECRVLHKSNLSEKIKVNTGVRQGCVLSPLLFIAVLDGVLKKTNIDSPNGIQWGLSHKLNDLDYADDIVLLAHKHSDIQHKLTSLHRHAKSVGLKININKTRIMRSGASTTTPVLLDGQPIVEVEEFVYLGGTITTNGGTVADVSNRINKARQAFWKLNEIWNNSMMSTKYKIRLYNACVKSVLLYGCESWKVTVEVSNKLQVFSNKCLRRIVRKFWPDGINNSDLLQVTQQIPVMTEIQRRKWQWIGHTLRKAPEDITRSALEWNPQGRRKRGRPALSWRRTLDKEINNIGISWKEIKSTAQDRSRFKEIVDALCSIRR